jgi:hypothetical protein
VLDYHAVVVGSPTFSIFKIWSQNQLQNVLPKLKCTEIILNAGQFVISMCLLVAVCFIRWLGAVRELKIRYGYEIWYDYEIFAVKYLLSHLSSFLLHTTSL